VRKIVLLCLLCAAALSSCVVEQAPEINANIDIDSVAAAGGKVTVVLDCNREKWTASLKNSNWAHIVSVNRNPGGSGSVVISCDPNSSEYSRTNTLVISVEGITEKVSFSQMQKDVVKITTKFYELDYEGAEISVESLSNVDYVIVLTEDWISQAQGTKALVSKEDRFVIEPYGMMGAEREGDIVYRSPSGEELSRIHIVQNGPDPITAVTVPGLYGLQGVNYFASHADASQMSLLYEPGGTVSARFMYPLTVSVTRVSGLPSGVKKGDELNLDVKVIKNSVVAYDEGRTFTCVMKKDSVVWLKDISDSNVYLVVEMEEESL